MCARTLSEMPPVALFVMTCAAVSSHLGPPITTGKLFLFDAFVGDDAGLAHGQIFYSDGMAAPQVYLEPSEPGTYYGRPIYANS